MDYNTCWLQEMIRLVHYLLVHNHPLTLTCNSVSFIHDHLLLAGTAAGVTDPTDCTISIKS